MEVCPKCKSSEVEILESGFVGCEKCYDLPNVKHAVDNLTKRHKG